MMRALKTAFFFIAIACLAWFAWQSRDLLGDVLANARPLYLALAVLLWIPMNVFAGVFATQVFGALGSDISCSATTRIHVANLPARYVPGGIWHTVGRAANYRAMNISTKDIAVFVFLENVLAVCVAFAIGGVLLHYTREPDAWRQVATLSAIAGGAFLILSPLLLARFTRTGAVRFPARPFLLLTATTACAWCLAAASFVCYVSAFPTTGVSPGLLEVAGSYLFSWGVGFLAIFAPQGIGVFEVVAADLLRNTAPLMGVAALLAGFRLVILAADAIAFTALQVFSGPAVSQGSDLLGDKPDQENNH